MRRIVAISVLGFFLAASACGGCSEPDTPEPNKTKKKANSKPEVKADAGSIEDQRMVFGVVLPPQVIRVKKYPKYARAETQLKLPEVKSFYQDKLVDYEISEHKRLIKWVGLRDFMPEIQASQMSWRAPTIVTIYKRESTASPIVKPAPQADVKPKVEVIIGGRDLDSKKTERPFGQYKKGARVELVTPDGELLAPGARWGEPYTPPKGSPMDRARYKSHFGKPFGTWTLQ